MQCFRLSRYQKLLPRLPVLVESQVAQVELLLLVAEPPQVLLPLLLVLPPQQQLRQVLLSYLLGS
jgi:hypothetical protein